MIPDRSSPSRVRFAASRPGLLRTDPKGWLFTREKGGLGFSGWCPGRKGTFRPYQWLEPQPRGRVTRRAVADSCVPIGSPRGSLSPQQQDRTQTSRGKSDRLHRTPAGSTALAFDGSGLRDQLSARPTKDASYPVSVRQVAVLFHASSRPRLAATPLRFPSTSLPSSCAEDFHLQASRHARHTTRQPSLDAHFNTNVGATLARQHFS